MRKKFLSFVAFSSLTVVIFFSSCKKEGITPTDIETGSDAIAALSYSGGSDDAKPSKSTDTTTTTNVELTGNGTPSGSHYQLNIIGVPKGKKATMTSGNRIFVPLYGNCKIMLKEGPDFDVLDANGTDGVAQFQLPNPDPNNTGYTTYTVYSRAVAGNGSSTMTTCATSKITGELICSNESLVSVKSTKFTNVSRQLLYIYADVDGDGVAERYPLFDDALEDYFWNYDNNGLKVLQLQFYDGLSTNVN